MTAPSESSIAQSKDGMPPQELEDLPAAADLYEYRSTDDGGVPIWLPYNQGDVFGGVPLLGLTGEQGSGYGMLFLHPCTMRQGRAMAPRATVLHVRTVSAKKPLDEPRHWNRKYSAIPLPDFSGNGADALEADLLTMTTVQTNALTRVNRVAQLSEIGRSHMLHRVIFHLTRMSVPTQVLLGATARVQAEVQLQGDWTASAFAANGGLTLDQVEVVEAAFQAELDRAWPEGGQGPGDSVRARLHSEDDEEHDESFRYVAELAAGSAPWDSLQGR